MIQLSVVVPTFNSSLKLRKCLSSLVSLAEQLSSMEVLFVDDSSTDSTYEILRQFADRHSWARIHRLEENSGSPSTPRNVGTQLAEGKFVFFLDSDDEILPSGIKASLEIAEREIADVVRAPLIRDDGHSIVEMNQLSDWTASWPIPRKIAEIIARQSTTVCAVIRRDFLLRSGVIWPTQIRMGEDTVFWTRLLAAAKSLSYNPLPDFVYHTATVKGSVASTQRYENRELSNHLEVWRIAADALESVGIHYFQSRGQVALQSVFNSLLRFNRNGVSRQLFAEFHKFVIEQKELIDGFSFSSRLAEIWRALRDNDYDSFIQCIKLRLAIAGHDLKFISSAIEGLEDEFQVMIDEWSGHDTHDIDRSTRLLEWADVIHAEWLLGNANWYAENKRKEQTLVVRGHRFELTRQFGQATAHDNVDRYLFVSLPTLEDFARTFPLDRSKVRLVPNFLEIDKYKRSQTPDKVYNLAMIGILASNKGYFRALELLRDLRTYDQRYNLTIYGKRPQEVPWVLREPSEADYYQRCDDFLTANGLEQAVTFAGWADMRHELADKGFVLSLSDFESFHVAAAEAFAAENVALLLPWEGAEYIYPSEYIARDVVAMRDQILSLQKLKDFDAFAAQGAKLVKERYSLDSFLRSYSDIIREAR